jgi:hypothetical protein
MVRIMATMSASLLVFPALAPRAFAHSVHNFFMWVALLQAVQACWQLLLISLQYGLVCFLEQTFCLEFVYVFPHVCVIGKLVIP